MKRFIEVMHQLIIGMSKAVFRFPLTVISLVGAASLICYMISIDKTPSLVIQKLMFAFLVGSILGMAAQFAIERFERLTERRSIVYGISALLTVGYFLILWPAPEISAEIGVRTFVAVFALICAVLWIPSYKDKACFNQIALIHFKSVFTSVLFSGVLSGGIAAIIATVDILLFNVNSDAYAYMMTIIWVLFATIYYLSLLPKFNSTDETDMERTQEAGSYPKFLNVLVSYIAIPLITAYTVVLFAYFGKILVTMHWPSGQLGPMVLIYSAIGLLVFVLASLLENRFTALYRKVFPKVLIPVVIMQLISVWIRLNAYGVTESRYYVVLFGLFSIVIAMILSFKPASKNGYIALLAAGFAIFSVIPPMDAFTVSRVSQINRVEKYLQSEGILVNGKLTPQANVSKESKIEITNILSYLDRSSSHQYIKWLPEDFNMYEDMKSTFGFEPMYGDYAIEYKYFHASVDNQKPIVIADYDIGMNIYSDRYRYDNGLMSTDFDLNGKAYVLSVHQQNQEARVLVKDSIGTELIGADLSAFIKGLEERESTPKEMLPPELMTLEVSQNGYKLKILFQNVNINYDSEQEPVINFSAMVLFGV